MARYADAKEQISRDLVSAISTCLGLFIGLWIIPLLFVFAYYPLPTLVRLITALLFVASLIPLWSVPGSTLAASLSVCVLTSAFCGLHVFYANVLPLKALTEGRTYAGVYAQQPALAFSDASVLAFAGNATVDGTRAASFTALEGGAQTYCAAPIRDASSGGRVEFWAVGLNCCPAKLGSFECDAAGNPGASTGVVVPDLQEGDDLYNMFGKYLAHPEVRRDFFLEAVRQAEISHDLQSSSRPVLVRWVAQSREKLQSAQWRAITLTLVVLFLVVGTAAVLLTGMAMNHELLSMVWHPWATGKLAEAEWKQMLRADVLLVAPTISDFEQVNLLGLVVPYLVLMSSIILWSWTYCYSSAQVMPSLFMCIVAFVVLSLLLARQTWIYGLLTLFCAAFGSYIGRRNYFVNTFHYCSSRRHNSYGNVPPDSGGAEFQDAGKMRFSQDAVVSRGQSFGYLYDGTTYCAAPIMSSSCASSGSCGCGGDGCAAGSLAAPARTDFWAVGVDCCGDTGGFLCGAGPNASISEVSGVVLRDSSDQGVEDAARLPYLRAVQAASDHFGFVPPDEPLLIQWDGAGATYHEKLWVGRAIQVILVSAVLGCLVLSCLVSFVHYRAKRRNRAPGAALRAQAPPSTVPAPPAP